jgi:hypothetical protein
MTEHILIPPNPKALEEALGLSEEILRNIELNELPLINIALKALRLSRLLNDFDMQETFKYEVSGYPTTPDGVPIGLFQLAVKADRGYQQKDEKSGIIKNFIYLESIEQLEHDKKIAEISLQAAQDRDVSISSANPHQTVYNPTGNWLERKTIRENSQLATKRLSSRRALLYEYTLRKHYELKFSGIADDIFSRIRERVDSALGAAIPDAVNKLAAVYDNLRSDNPEDWSNAVHSCRRILQDLADAIYPPREDRVIEKNGKSKTIKLGKDNYINRIIAFVEERTESNRFSHIVGSHLTFLGDRLDSVFKAAQKGSHDVIVSIEEADRYVVYTYLIVGDVLTLLQ